MKQWKILTTIKAAFYFIAFTALTTACNIGQGMGMMREGTGQMYMGSWNWILILIGSVIGFLIGYLVARRRK